MPAAGQEGAPKGGGGHRAILDQGWGEFRQQLAYKMEWNGGMLLATPSYHTSQTCPDEGIGGAVTARTSPFKQQVAPGFSKRPHFKRLASA
jgi:putative transposase